MAATNSNLKAPLTWLEVCLAYHRADATIDLLITFVNQSSVLHELAFSNHTRKAELLGLHITDQTGCRILPTHNLLIKSARIATQPHLLMAGETFTYVLSGIVTKQGLEFPGAIFTLQAGESYQFQFYYAGQKSNSLTLFI